VTLIASSVVTAALKVIGGHDFAEAMVAVPVGTMPPSQFEAVLKT
jgi:hypothetical protein